MTCPGFGCVWGVWKTLPFAINVTAFVYVGESTFIIANQLSGKLLVSHDFGVTWSEKLQLGTNTGVRSLLSLEPGRCLAGTTPLGQIFETLDYGDSWHLIASLTPETGVYVLSKSITGTLFAGTYPHSQIWRSIDDGDTWIFSQALAATLNVVAISDTGTGRIIACAQANSFLDFSDDDGLTFPTVNRKSTSWPVSLLTHVVDSILLYFTSDNRHLYRSVDGGLTWSDLGILLLSGFGRMLGATESGQYCFLAGTDRRFRRSGDYGVTWDTPTGLVTPSNIIGFVSFGDSLAFTTVGSAKQIFCTPVTIVIPVASFSGSPISGLAPLSVQFTDTSTNTPVVWLWDFGDGETSTEQNPLHVYADDGIYDVSLTVTNPGGTDVLIKSDYITVESPTPPTPYVDPIWSLQIGLL